MSCRAVSVVLCASTFVLAASGLIVGCTSSGAGPADLPSHDPGPAPHDGAPGVLLDAGALSGDAAVATDASASDAAAASDGAVSSGTTPVLAVNQITGATPDELLMIADGVSLANQTMATDCFRSFVMAASWTETNGLTQAQIWDLLCSNPVTVDLEMYTGSWYDNHVTHTVGYENEPGVVHANRYFVDTAYMVADNLIHEAEGHSQGFSHYGVKETSVPYGLNLAFETCSPVGP